MKYYKSSIIFLFPFLLFFHPYETKCQLRIAGEPPSSTFNLPRDVRGMNMVPSPDLTVTLQEDEKYPSPYRFGIILPVDISPDRSGSWTTLSDGSQIWRAMVSAPHALALTAYFDRFHIPEGGKLFIYNQDKSQVIGAFSPLNNSISGLFSTELIAGDEMTLEYFKPAGSDLLPQLHLNEIAYAYRGVGFLDKYGTNPVLSGKCEVNVICPEGDAWQNQKKGVTRIEVKRGGATYWCSGSLINNTKVDNIPYVLTANHCGYNATEKELQQWVFYFDFESLDCKTPVFPVTKSLVGATLKAHSGDQLTSGSDFYLLRLNENIPDSFHAFFTGWSRREDSPSPSGVGIHHPGGALKKISTYKTTLGSTTWSGNPGLTHWEVIWAQTVSGHGVTEPGSSGSPLFDNQGRIVGALSGGESACDSLSLNLPDYYGKFSWSWASDGKDSTSRLKDWLDPGSMNLLVLDGVYLGIREPFKPFIQVIYPNPFEDVLTIRMNEKDKPMVHIAVYDLPGRELFAGDYYQNDEGSIQMKLGFLPKGLYLLKIGKREKTICRKIIRQ